MSAIFYYVNNKKLNENQKDPKLHYFIFDHFIFRWLPNSFRKWARFGLINPEFDTVRDTQTKKYKISIGPHGVGFESWSPRLHSYPWIPEWDEDEKALDVKNEDCQEDNEDYDESLEVKSVGEKVESFKEDNDTTFL